MAAPSPLALTLSPPLRQEQPAPHQIRLREVLLGGLPSSLPAETAQLQRRLAKAASAKQRTLALTPPPNFSNFACNTARQSPLRARMMDCLAGGETPPMLAFRFREVLRGLLFASADSSVSK